MSRLVLLEVAMKTELHELHEIYFGGTVPIHYEESVPFIVVGTSQEMSEAAAVEFSRGCEQLKMFHKETFGIEVKSFVTSSNHFNKVNNWWKFFHPNGRYI
ncbi:hypothetical protein DRW41_05110 [Neobacillus piezotolerans]|uniref:Uncharacterized protein n=1 Tax=Neobacillus piezotolerans TaxID=2259171 RepID=A0A3D8GY03_9BACI|nr:hypothetical protein [Neobacillus piezotolerans]RDU38936.1 hypothetical protein DRW41_05110 [Neobacillus piezotolerans]